MKDLIRGVLSEQILSKVRVNPNLYGCFLLKDKTEQEFCRAAEKKIKNDKSSIKKQFNEILGLGLSDESIQNKLLRYERKNSFFLQSRRDLFDFTEKITGSCDTAKISIENEIKDLNKKIVVLFKDKQNSYYHLINRLDTNYTALSYLLTVFRRNSSQKTSDNKLYNEFDIKSEVEKFYNLYFNISEIKRDNGENSVFFQQVFNYLGDDKKMEESLKDTFEDVLYSIERTRQIGLESEEEGFSYLKNKYPNNEIVSYAGDFNFVDMIGVDGVMWSIKSNVWIPIQIKTSILGCEYGNKRFCKNMCIGKNKKGEWVERYYDGNTEINL